MFRMCNTSSRPQLFYTGIVLSIPFKWCINSVLVKSTAYQTQFPQYQRKMDTLPKSKFSVKVVNNTREDSVPLPVQPELRKGRGSCRAVDKAVHWGSAGTEHPKLQISILQDLTHGWPVWGKLLCSGLLPPSLPTELVLKAPFLPQSN